MSRQITLDEVKKHNSAESLWVVVNGKVYDVTQFAKEHPGGEEILLEHGGIDATQDFEDVGHSSDARELQKKYLIGTIVEDKPVTPPQQSQCCQMSGCGKWIVPAVVIGLLGIGIVVAYRLRK